MWPVRSFYLDLCCLNRPFDDQHQPRVRLAAEAILGLIQLAILGEFHWMASDAREARASNGPPTRRDLDPSSRQSLPPPPSPCNKKLSKPVPQAERGSMS
jgi:hypothetical protein